MTTNLDAVKAAALGFLDYEIEETMFAGIIRHPFTTSTLCVVRSAGIVTEIIDITQSEENMRRWKDTIAEVINSSSSVPQILIMVTRPYRFRFLSVVYPFLSEECRGECLAYVWTDSEDPGNAGSVELLELMFSATLPEYLMTDHELDVLDNLPEVVRVYRGVGKIHEDHESERLSWTLDIDVARKFAKRFKNSDKGHIYSGFVNKRDILAYFDSRNEKEVICRPYNLHIAEW